MLVFFFDCATKINIKKVVLRIGKKGIVNGWNRARHDCYVLMRRGEKLDLKRWDRAKHGYHWLKSVKKGGYKYVDRGQRFDGRVQDGIRSLAKAIRR